MNIAKSVAHELQAVLAARHLARTVATHPDATPEQRQKAMDLIRDAAAEIQRLTTTPAPCTAGVLR